MVHVNNEPVHNSRMTGIFFEYNPLKGLPHPPYSPNISASDFYLLGKVMEVLIEQEIPDDIGVFDAVTQILNGVSTDELQHVFRS
jgi:hypothetical protein